MVLRYERERDRFLNNIVMGDEIWLHHFYPKNKRTSMGSDTKNSPRKNKIKKIERYVRDSAEVILTDFWDIPSVVYFKLVAESAAII